MRSTAVAGKGLKGSCSVGCCADVQFIDADFAVVYGILDAGTRQASTSTAVLAPVTSEHGLPLTFNRVRGNELRTYIMRYHQYGTYLYYIPGSTRLLLPSGCTFSPLLPANLPPYECYCCSFQELQVYVSTSKNIKKKKKKYLVQGT